MRWTDIVERRSAEVVILELRGRMTLSEPPGGLTKLIRRLVERGNCRFLLNLRHAHYIDSEGLADIIDAFKTARDAGGTLKLCEVAVRIRELLTITNLATVLEAFDSEQEALTSFVSAEA